MRPLLGLVAGAATAAVGALIVGEYRLGGVTAVAAGAVFGLVVGEVVVAAGGRQDLTMALATALVVTAGLVWAAWIWSGQPWSGLPGGALLAVATGVVVSLVWVTRLPVRAAERRGDDSPHREP